MTSTRSLRSRLRAWPAILFIFTTPPSVAEQTKISDLVPAVEGLDVAALSPADHPEALPAALLDLARRRIKETEEAPKWFRRLVRRPVGSYFPKPPKNGSAAADHRVELLADAVRVFTYYQSQDTSGQFDGFVSEKLAPFVASLRADQIDNPIRQGVLTEPVAKWSIESLVVRQMVGFLGKYRDFSKRALGLLTGRHLRGAGAGVSMLIGWTVAYHYFPTSTWSTTLFLGGFVGLALTGPFNAVTTAAAGFFVRPTTELVKTLGARLTGDLEAKINRGYDWLVAKLPAKGDNEHNDTVMIATFEDEHTDFARMSPEDQLKNWARGLNIFIMVVNIFSRLLRDTHHGGRDLMMLSWTDSQNISQLVELLDTKEHVLRGLEMQVLAPYRAAQIARGAYVEKNELDRRVREFNLLTEQVWLHPDMDQRELDELAVRIDAAADTLREYGLNDHELRKLLNIQRDRGRAIGKLITAVSIGHLRQFYGAERNRNLAKDAKAIALAIQVGFGTEEYTERYLPLVRRQMRLMGMQFSDADPESPIVDPVVVARERCLIANLRSELRVMTSAKPETYACINALIGYESHRVIREDADGPIARLLTSITSHGTRLEAGGIIKYARTVLGDQANVNAGIERALAGCH